MKNLFLFLAGISLVALTNSFCGRSEVFDGKATKKELTGLKDFDAIANGFSGDVIVTKGDEYKVVFEGDEKVLSKLDIEVKNGSLNIENKSSGWNWSSNKPVRFYVTMPSLKKIALGGSGNIETTNAFAEDNMKIALGGSGNIRLKGRATRQEIALGGSGNVDLSDLEGEVAKISIGGSGNVEVAVKDRLSVAIGGSGDVIYKGSPDIEQSISGSGSVRQR
jgi:Putative auto-transporter adhesin, head GIN domain